MLLGHCADAVAAVQAGRSLTEALQACPGAARPGAQALAFEVMRVLAGAQAARQQLAPRRPPPRTDALLISALALLWPGAKAVYAAHTVVDQAVAAARAQAAASAGFVNAVLRRFLRERDALLPKLQAADVAVRHQHPRWWIERLQRDWPQAADAILAADQDHAPMLLRVNARQTDAATYATELQAAGLGEAQRLGEHALRLPRPLPVGALPGFASGRVSVQDLSAQLAAPLLLGEPAASADALLGPCRVTLAPGARVLDACAAPGGKTAHLLELAELDLLALDADADRLAKVGEALGRLGLRAELMAADARRPVDWWDGRPFDAILLDAPCSASGIVRRHPDARWLRRPGDIAELARTQAELLDALWPLLKPGGRLVYATCSVFRAEGQAQIDAFAQRAAGVISRSAPGHLLPVADNRPQDGGPGRWCGDGFFYARLDKAA
ncbi:MAG TPA: 16S rRNA (cytosine(967)-C(5))-methyltransferase RsmB [Burkholderiaceae bacterium]|nr:16S rRNA (cytosine(967)-C(5))-methyltransferase RsmB [Burkholderiaceae bacterium]